MDKNWVLKEFEIDKVEQLRKKLPIHLVFCKLLVMRGIATYDEAQQFFRPSLDSLHDPFLMKGMKNAVKRINQAIVDNKKILIYGDYDVDGTTSVSLVYSFLKNYTKHIDYYIPNRNREGYGISIEGIDWAAKNDFGLVIALDCGIKDVEKVAYATESGVDFIICDHHLPGKKVPDAVAVLDPKQKRCTYPYKELSGCGIGFKLIQAYQKKYGTLNIELEAFLDLVAVSIASDIVPVKGENRILAFHGLKRLNSNPRPGLAELMNIAGLDRQIVDESTGEVTTRVINASDIVFVIGPRINAAGRIEDAKSAVQALISETAEEAIKPVQRLNKFNESRKNFDKQMTLEAIEMAGAEIEEKKIVSIVLFKSTWHKGVVGIVASRVVEQFYKPTILLAENDGMAVGSARSVEGFNIYDAIEACSDVLERFGGHKYAAGLTLKVENVPAFKEKFEKYVSKHLGSELMIPKLLIDCSLEFSDITPSFYKLLDQFAPFGPGNIRPKFVSNDVKNAGYSKIVGQNHLKLAIKQHGETIKYGIAFGKGEYLPLVKENRSFDICYALKENHWNGRTNIELDVKDLKFA